MRSIHGGTFARLVAGGTAVATAAAGLTLALSVPAQAAPVGVTGIMTDAAGNGLDGSVTAYALQPSGFYSYVSRTYVADGQVALNVEPGTYKFEFDDADGTFVGEYYNDKATLDAADAVPVTGPTALAPVALAARPLLTGQVVTAAGKPIKNADVTVYNGVNNTYITQTSTRADGTWAAGVDLGGAYKVRFDATGFAFEYYNNKATVEAADAVPTGTNLGQVALSRGSIVAGVVTNDAGVPLERARAAVYTAGGSMIASDLTDATGTYRVEGIDPGTYRVQFTDPVGEYLSEWNADKATLATADPVDVPVEAVATVNAALAPDPDAAIDPTTIDVSGIVVDSAGAPVIGAEVVAFDTPADADDPEATDFATTGRTGRFNFVNLSETSEAAFKVRAIDALEREEGQYSRLTRWSGNAQTYGGAAVVTKPAAGVTITMPLTGGISGGVTSESSLPVDGTQVLFFDEKGNPVNESTTFVEDDGTYSATSLVPGTYRVRFVQSDPFSWFYNFEAVPQLHAPEWYDDTTFEKARKIVVRSGQTVTGIDAALNKDLRAFRKPEINGKPYLGGKVRAYPGVWSLDSGTTYSYEWLVGDTVVGTGSTYKVTRAAKNKRVTLRVRAENGSFSGTALVASQVIKKKPKVKIAVKGAKASVTVSAKKVKAKKFKGTVVVKKIVRTDDFGAPVYKKIGKARLRNGKASLTLKKLTKGKNKVVFLITLKGGKYGDAEVARTIKVKKR